MVMMMESDSMTRSTQFSMQFTRMNICEFRRIYILHIASEHEWIRTALNMHTKTSKLHSTLNTVSVKCSFLNVRRQFFVAPFGWRRRRKIKWIRICVMFMFISNTFCLLTTRPFGERFQWSVICIGFFLLVCCVI